MSEGMDFYDLLGVGPEATPEDIRRAFRTQVREYHPDLNDDPRAPAQFTALKKAYDTLADPKERDAYDRLGHEEYVSERISGLPSVDHWQSPDGDGEDASPDPSRTAGNGASSRQGSTASDTNGTSPGDRPGGDGPSDADARDSPEESDWGGGPDGDDVEFDFEFDFDFDAEQDGVTAEETDAGAGAATGSGTTVRADSGSSMDGFVIGSDGPSAEAGGLADAVEFDEESFRDTATSKSPTASGAGTARGPKTAPDPGEPRASTASATDEYIEDDAGTSGPSLTERLRRGVQWTLGWPLVAFADVLYFATLGVYYLANAEGVAALVAAVGTQGLTAGVLGSSYGIDGLAGIVAGTAAGSTPLFALVAIMGVTVLPSVYLLLVRWTRRNRRAWQPSYLYVVGAMAPAAGMVLSGTVAPSGLGLDLLAYVVVPLVTMGAMVFFGQLLPRGRRLVRQYVYRLTN